MNFLLNTSRQFSGLPRFVQPWQVNTPLKCWNNTSNYPTLQRPALPSRPAMYRLLRKLLFTQSPEYIHYWAMARLRGLYQNALTRPLLKSTYGVDNAGLEREVFGLKFPNPVGLAAGFDKDARWTDELSALGFGFVEIGTVTPRPQPGNDKPRLFRLPQDQALINRMGFNNGGAGAAAERLRHRKERGLIIGGNIGKNKTTPNEQATEDYEAALRALYDVVDYFVVNVSSPNTPGLRELQDKAPLLALLQRLQMVNDQLGAPKPLLLKIAPDLTDSQLDDIVEIAATARLAGIVATNTTISREGLRATSQELETIGAGGLSGKPLRERATEVVAYLHKKNPALPIIAAGGIFTAADAREKLAAGASLIQVYTGFIYEGPGIAKRICQGLAKTSS